MFDVLERVDTVVEDGIDPVKRIETALSDLAVEDRDHWTSHSLSERVIEVVAVQERLAAEALRLVGEWDRVRAWEADGSLSAAAWLEHRTPLAAHDARKIAKTSRLVDRHESLAAALRNGEVAVPHVSAIERVASRERLPLLADHIDTLTAQARSLSIRDFTVLMRRWAAMADDDLAADTHEKKWERRHLYASVTLDGWVAGTFMLDPAGGQTLLNRLDAMAPPDPGDAPDGPRSLAQRRADALAELADIPAGTDGTTSANPPNLNVVVDLAALVGDTAGQIAARRDLDGIGPITRTTFEQLACCGTVSRLVTAGDSVVLDMGRAVRVVTNAQKRALAVRDRHCQFPSCHRSAGWCDAHHIVAWAAGGDTDLDNLVLLCRRHHTLIHQTRWTITRPSNGGVHFTHPARGP